MASRRFRGILKYIPYWNPLSTRGVASRAAHGAQAGFRAWGSHEFPDYFGGAVTPGVPPSLPGIAPPCGACSPRVPGGRSEHTSLQLLPTLTTESTWSDAAADTERGVNTPFNSTS